jgi:hypothetical protein
MNDWQIYEDSRWDIIECRKRIAQLRAIGSYAAVKLGGARIISGKAFYHILIKM